MNVETEAVRRGPCQEEDLVIALCTTLAFVLQKYPEADRRDIAEVVWSMDSQSAEDVAEGKETIREILRSKPGSVIPLDATTAERPDKVSKWSSYAGNVVRTRRKAAKLTQGQLALRAKLPQSHISRIESGEISPTRMTLEKIAKALGAKISDFDPSE